MSQQDRADDDQGWVRVRDKNNSYANFTIQAEDRMSEHSSKFITNAVVKHQQLSQSYIYMSSGNKTAIL